MTDNIQHIIDDQFLDIKLSKKNIASYIVRKSILKGVYDVIPKLHGRLLDLGCGIMPYKKLYLSNPNVTKYIGMDLVIPTYHNLVEPDMGWDGSKIGVDNGSIDCVTATEFFEHYEDTEHIFTEILRVLRPGGLLFGTMPFVWELHEAPYDHHRFTPYYLEAMLLKAGYININIKPLGGWNAALAQIAGLWLHRKAPSLPRWKVSLLFRTIYPFYKWLIRTDVTPDKFGNYFMYNSLSFTAEKAKT